MNFYPLFVMSGWGALPSDKVKMIGRCRRPGDEGDGDVTSVGTTGVLFFPPLIASVGTIAQGNEKPRSTCQPLNGPPRRVFPR